MIRGCDVSAVQGLVDWQALAHAGIRFAYLKASEGNRGNDPVLGLPEYYLDRKRMSGVSGTDPYFDRNVAGARAAGIAVGPYHFGYCLPPQAGNPLRDPEAQAKYAYDVAAGVGQIGDLPPAFDFEWPAPQDWGKWGCDPTQLRAWALTFLNASQTLWGRTPVVYSYPDFWKRSGADSEPAFARFRLWAASYPHPDRWPTDGEKPAAFPPFADWTFWQFTGGGMRLPNGVPVDYDCFNGDEVAFQALLAA